MKILDRYIIRQFFATLLFGLLALCTVFLVVSLLEDLDDFIDKKTPALIILQYYLNFFPEVLELLTPVGMLLASLFTIGKLANNNEITAMKSGGMSVYRLMTPLLIFSVLMSFGQLYFNGWIVPASNQRKANIEHKYLDRGRFVSSLYNVYFRDEPTRNVLIQFYDDVTKKGNKISIENYSSEMTPRILKRIDAGTFAWDSVAKVWKLYGGLEHDFTDGHLIVTRRDTLTAILQTTPEELIRLQRTTKELNFDELREYINLSKRGGKDVRQQLIDYYGQYALPFANFIVVLFGIPFSSGKRKGGLAVEIGAAIFVSFLYLVFTKIGQTIGYSMDLNPIVSGWLANGIFFFVGLVNLLRIRS